MTTKPMPEALVKRAQTLAKQKFARILAEAHGDIALIREKRDDITAAFYDIGEALVRLKRPEVHNAFGFKTWDQFCAKELAISPTQAARLVDIVTSMTRQEAIKLQTSSKASSVAELVAATASA